MCFIDLGFLARMYHPVRAGFVASLLGTKRKLLVSCFIVLRFPRSVFPPTDLWRSELNVLTYFMALKKRMNTSAPGISIHPQKYVSIKALFLHLEIHGHVPVAELGFHGVHAVIPSGDIQRKAQNME